MLLLNLIPNAFKKCGLCNDVYGREAHLIEVQHMLTYKAFGPNFKWMYEPYTKEEILAFHKKEVKAQKDKRKKRDLTSS